MAVGLLSAVGATAAVGGIVGGPVISAISAGNAGAAQADAAKQQVQMSRDALSQQIQARAEGIALAKQTAALSPNEIASINKMFSSRDAALSASLGSIQKQQANLDAMDPVVKASGQQAYDLITGKSATILGPMQTHLAKQRQSLVDNLSSQMGPGFMTSSAGISALTQFDSQASLTLNQAQMSVIQSYGSLAGLQQQGQASITAGTQSAFGQAIAADAAGLQAFQFGQTRETNAVLGAMSANPLNPFGVPAAQNNVVQTAGGPYAAGGALGGALTSLGGHIAGAAMSGGMGGGGVDSAAGVGGGGANPFNFGPGGLAGQVGYGADGTLGGNANGYSGNFGARLMSM